MRRAVDFLYSLYDALVSINVPNDKARAVVDAMERDMTTSLATKRDLEPLVTKLEFAALDARMSQLEQRLDARIGGLEQRLDARIDGLEQRLDARIDGVEQRLDARIVGLADRVDSKLAVLRSDVARDMAELGHKLTLRMGAMMATIAGLTLAAARLL